MNLYAYAGNNPVAFRDPWGLKRDCLPACAVAAAYMVYEVASAVFDINNATRTVRDPDASWLKKGLSVGLALFSVVLPGGGWTAGTDFAEDVLKSATTIGRPGSREGIREVVGTTEDAEKLFRSYSEGLDIRPHRNVGGGLEATTPGNGFIGFRPDSKSGGAAVEVNLSGIQQKVHFVEK